MQMELEFIRNELKSILTASRYHHSEGVEDVAHDLALIHGYDTNNAVLAGLLHDCAKYLNDQELLEECKKRNLPVTDFEKKSVYLLHAKVGADFARTKYGVEDNEILSAITYHTTGRPAMTLLEKIIYTADYIEPFRKPLPKIGTIREAAYEDLDLAVFMVTENVLNYLTKIADNIDPMTIKTYEYYKNVLKQKSYE